MITKITFRNPFVRVTSGIAAVAARFCCALPLVAAPVFAVAPVLAGASAVGVIGNLAPMGLEIPVGGSSMLAILGAVFCLLGLVEIGRKPEAGKS